MLYVLLENIREKSKFIIFYIKNEMAKNFLNIIKLIFIHLLTSVHFFKFCCTFCTIGTELFIVQTRRRWIFHLKCRLPSQSHRYTLFLHYTVNRCIILDNPKDDYLGQRTSDILCSMSIDLILPSYVFICPLLFSKKGLRERN